MPRKHERVRVERGLYREGDVYWACATPTGEQRVRWHKIGAVGVQAARRERDKFAYRLKSGAITPVRRVITIGELADEWFARLDERQRAGELRPRAVDSYKSGVRLHVLPFWKSRDVRSISADDLVIWHERQKALGASRWSIRARWISIRGLLGHATRLGYLSHNPCDSLTQAERPKSGRNKTRYLDIDEMGRLLAIGDLDTRVANGLLIFTGGRAAEVLGLVWSDIDFAEEFVKYRCQMSRSRSERVPLKTENGPRDVILMKELGLLLREKKMATRFSRANDLVIANGIGNTLGYGRLLKSFRQSASAAGIHDATPHTCRHTFASILIDQGRSVEFVSQQLGHSSTKTTWDIYVHLFRAREHADAARRDLDAGFGHMLRAINDESPPA